MQATAHAKNANTHLEANLAPGERVLWRGKPVQRAFVWRTWPLSIFGGVLIATVVAFEAVILTTEAPDLLAVWGVPFALAGLYMAVGHFLLTYREWLNTEYVVTEQRVLIRHGIFSPVLTIYSLLGLPQTTVEMRGDGVGNIIFRPQQGHGYGPWPGYQMMWPYTPGYLVGLLYIRNPDEVQRLIETHRRS